MTAQIPYADQPDFEPEAGSADSTDSDIDLQGGPAETWDDWGSDGEDAFGTQPRGQGAYNQGEYELDERNALRRVAGLSTELEDVSEVEYRQLRLERVVLVSVWTDGTRRGRRQLAGRAQAARGDGRLAGARRPLPAPAEA